MQCQTTAFLELLMNKSANLKLMSLVIRTSVSKNGLIQIDFTPLKVILKRSHSLGFLQKARNMQDTGF